jgi:ABC-type lipoprotein release transport system permease subunit
MQQQLLLVVVVVVVLVVVVVVVVEEVEQALQQTLSEHAVQIDPHLIVDHAMCASGKYGTTACGNAQQAPVAL